MGVVRISRDWTPPAHADCRPPSVRVLGVSSLSAADGRRRLSAHRAASSSASVMVAQWRRRTFEAKSPGALRVATLRACSAAAKKFNRSASLRFTWPALQACSNRHARRALSVRSAGTICRSDGLGWLVRCAGTPAPRFAGGFWFVKIRRSSGSLIRGGKSPRGTGARGGNSRRRLIGDAHARLTVTRRPQRFRNLCPTGSNRSKPNSTSVFRAALTLRTSTPKRSLIQLALQVPVGRHSPGR